MLIRPRSQNAAARDAASEISVMVPAVAPAASGAPVIAARAAVSIVFAGTIRVVAPRMSACKRQHFRRDQRGHGFDVTIHGGRLLRGRVHRRCRR